MKTSIAELIKAARAQAEKLRRASFGDADDLGQMLTRAEAKLWQELADSAELAMVKLLRKAEAGSNEP